MAEKENKEKKVEEAVSENVKTRVNLAAKKESVMDEDALIYRREREKTEKEKLSGMNKKEKLQYLRQYYGVKALLVVCVIVFSVYLGIHFATMKDNVLGILAVNGDGENPVAVDTEFFKPFLEENGLDTEDNVVSVNYSLFINPNANDSISTTTLESIQVLFFSQAVDVFVADENFFMQMAQTDYISDLTEYLPEEVLKKYEDKLVYADVLVSSDTGEEESVRRLVGVRIDANNKWLASTGWYKSEVIVGLAGGSEHAELALSMFTDILEEHVYE